MAEEVRKNRHQPNRRSFTLRFPMELYNWLHRTSVLERATKTDLVKNAVDWTRAQPRWADQLRAITVDVEGPRRTTSLDWPEETYVWLRIESSEHGWSSNELAIRALMAWRTHREP